jgi:plastocyanin
LAKPSGGSSAVGAVVAVLIVASVASIGYFQFNLAPSIFTTTTTTTTTSSALPPPGHYVNVSIVAGASSPGNLGFSPDVVTVVIGVNNTVVWTNNDAAPHTVTAKDNSFNSGNMNSGDVFQFTFNVPGTYKYGCNYHAWMAGTVIVKSA